MVRALNQYFPGRLFFLIATENALIVIGIWAAISLEIGSFRAELFVDPVLFGKAFLITAVCQLCLYFNDLYNLTAIRTQAELLLRLLKTLGMASFALALVYLVLPGTRFGNGIFETSVFAITLLILLWRVAIEWLNRTYGGEERVLLVGSGPIADALLRQLYGRTDLPLKVAGVVTDDHCEGAVSFPGVRVLGSLASLPAIAREVNPDRVVVALGERRDRLPTETLLAMLVRGVKIEDASSLYEKLTGKVPVDLIRPSFLFFSEGWHKSSATRLYKRSFGLVGALLGLVCLSPLLALIAIAIKLDSRGPVFYRQPRVGLGGRIFELIKFRSMRPDAESLTGPVWEATHDPRVTRVGRVIRRIHLDELPQLINVLWGDMSFVGPRPERPHFEETLRPQIHYYDVRHAVRPGITGWAQVSRPYARTIEESRDKLQYDLFYIKNMSLALDCLILVRTVKFVLFGLRTLPNDERRTQIEFIARTPSLPAMNRSLHEPIPAAMTVDVEDYFQVAAFRQVVKFEDWDRFESRVERNTQKVLEVLAESRIRGTFFILGWVAERHPALIRDILAAGHELGCHSYAHRFVYELSPDEFRADTARALRCIEDAAGAPVRAYRAPSFSITRRSLWALDILVELGFTLDCSIFPIHHDLYGFPTAPRQPFRIRVNGSTLLEFPPPTLRVGRWNLPVTGGGYLRQLPFEYQVQSLKALEERGEAVQLYVHPWEMDPDQPRIACSLRSRIRHYRGLNLTAARLQRLLGLFRFGPVSEVIKLAECVSEVQFSGSTGIPFPALGMKPGQTANAI